MKWTQAIINEQKQSHGISCDEFRIGRFTVFGVEKYGAWHRYNRIGYFSTAAEAKVACESLLLSLRPESAGDG